MSPHEGRPPHPRYGAPLGGKPVTIDGVVFRPYRAGIGMTLRASDDFRITVHANRGGRAWTYSASVDGVYVQSEGGGAKRFRTDRAACEAGVALLRQKGGAE
ncbi:MAG TPA: hypothetical protein VGK33_04435 [Chloroflexota bacterium]|jgi:hypothetical protein